MAELAEELKTRVEIRNRPNVVTLAPQARDMQTRTDA
jgi:hypothetical protein